jgi:cytochrome oxidase assembly protein ShyY1
MPLALGWTLALVLSVLFCTAGFWQLGRGAAKEAMLDDVYKVVTERDALPLSVAADPQRPRDLDWAAGSGRFADAPAVLLDNQIRESRPGIRVYRVFLPQAGDPLLVELGWLPLPPDRRLPVIEPLPDTMRVSGLLAPPPSAGIATPVVTATPQGLLAIGLDREVLSRALQLPGLAPRVLKLDPDIPVGYARDLDILPNTLTPERHLGYAVQWFGLAAAVLVIAVVMSVRQRRRRRSPHEKIRP